MSKALRKFEMEMAIELAALADDLEAAGRPELLPLDRSYASLDRVEAYYLLVLEGAVKADVARAERRVARHAGALVVEQAGGEWALGSEETEAFVVTRLRAAPTAVYCPRLRVGEIENYRYPGLLRDRTERYDLELQTRHIAALSADLPGTLARLREDATTQLQHDPGPLECTADLSRYEAALASVKAPSAPIELRRRIRACAAIAIGDLMQRELGAARWIVEPDPRDIDFGAWTLFGVRLTNLVERVDPKTKPDGLRTRVEKMIANKRR